MTAPQDKASIEWMYGGPSSSVNREDYLTGRRVDKNFERLNPEFQEPQSKLDFVVQNRSLDTSTTKQQNVPARRDIFTPASMLDLRTIKTEDPLVAIKVKEEQVRRELLDNPVKMKRFQNIIMKAMEKKMKKIIKKKESSSSDESASSSDNSAEKRHRRVSKNTDRNRSEKRDSSRKLKEKRDERPRKNSTPPSPKRRKRASSSEEISDDEKRRKKYAGYGLINVKERKRGSEISSDRSEKRKRSPSPPRKYSEKRIEEKNSKPNNKNSASASNLSSEEREAKLLEMTSNAKWRDEQRRENLKMYARREEEDKKRDTRQVGESVDFLRPMLSRAVDEGTVASSVKSKIQRIQRREDVMEKNFARK